MLESIYNTLKNLFSNFSAFFANFTAFFDNVAEFFSDMWGLLELGWNFIRQALRGFTYLIEYIHNASVFGLGINGLVPTVIGICCTVVIGRAIVGLIFGR